MFNMAKWRRTESERERAKQIRDGESGGERAKGRRVRAAEWFTLSNNSQSAIVQLKVQ